MAFFGVSHHIANQRATVLLYYFSIGYYHYLPILIIRVSRLSSLVVVRT